MNANASPRSNLVTPLDSPVDGGNKMSVARGYGSEDGGLLPLPTGPPAMERVNSSSSLVAG